MPAALACANVFPPEKGLEEHFKFNPTAPESGDENP